jgi:hypothetical protein
MFQTKVVEKIKAFNAYSIFFFENRAIYELMWKNVVQPDRPKVTIQCFTVKKRFSCGITEARIWTHTHITFNT